VYSVVDTVVYMIVCLYVYWCTGVHEYV